MPGRIPTVLVVLTLGVPLASQAAESLTQAVGLFNIFVGLMLVASLLAYGISFVVWVTRLGNWPSYRTTAIHIGEWAIVIIFVLVVMLMIVQFFRDHPHTAAVITGTLVVLLVFGIVMYLTIISGDKEEKDRG